VQIELEEARKLSRERLENQQLVASFDRWAEMLVPTVPENRVTTLVATPKRKGTGASGWVLVPKVTRKKENGRREGNGQFRRGFEGRA